VPPPSFGPAAPGMAFSTSASLLMRGEPRLRRRRANLGQLLSFIEPLELPALLFAAERLMHGPKLQCRDVRFTPKSGHWLPQETRIAIETMAINSHATRTTQPHRLERGDTLWRALSPRSADCNIAFEDAMS